MLKATIIQRATLADALKISELIRELSKQFLISPLGEGAEPFFAANSETAIQSYICASNYEYFIAESKGQFAGFVALRDNSHLFHLFVAKPFQGSGFGRQLWEMIKTRAIQSGNPNRFTVNSSLNAVPVYERFGFVSNSPIVQAHGVTFQPMQLG